MDAVRNDTLIARKRVRLADLARETGVTIPTVSYVLRNRARVMRISVELEKRIKTAAQQLGYRPNLLARSLITRRSMTIGVLVANLGESFYPAVMAQLHRRLRPHGYLLLFGNHYMDPKLFLEEVDALWQRSVDAIVLGPVPDPVQTDRGIRGLAAQGPVLAFEWVHPSLDSVLNRADSLGKAAADYLWKKGVRKPLAISLMEGGELAHGLNTVIQKRLDSFRKHYIGRPGGKPIIWKCASAESLAARLQEGLARNALKRFDGFLLAHTASAECFLSAALLLQDERILKAPTLAISGEQRLAHLRAQMAVLYQNPLTLADCLAAKILARIKKSRRKPDVCDIPAELHERA
ncbi:MAG: LacI family DNA-binding transcriptional regulator [Verrucomicrobiae bacterium]|nr:LacI family DNA-binding transcriptional regulator [Verrucomicrobiae bacterium]